MNNFPTALACCRARLVYWTELVVITCYRAGMGNVRAWKRKCCYVDGMVEQNLHTFGCSVPYYMEKNNNQFYRYLCFGCSFFDLINFF